MTANDKLAETRQAFFNDSGFKPNNQKYGLFSFSGTLAVSKEPYFQPTSSHKDADGKVITAPNNCLIQPPKSGKTADAYFTTFEYKGDRYADPIRLTKAEKERTEKIKKVHDNVWKPAANVDEPSSLFPHEASDRHVIVSRRLSDGSVRTNPKNFLTSPPRKGEAAVTPGVLLGPIYEHLTDEYDRKMKTARDDAKKSRARRHGGPFYSMDAGNNTFNPDESIYGGKFEMKESKRLKTLSGTNHDRPFYPANPSKKGSTIGPYPEHVPDPLRPILKGKPNENTPWKVTVVERSKPTPSIVSQISNLRNDFPILRKIS
jgi:hypothetical protein